MRINPFNYKSEKDISVKNGAVVSAQPLASAVGAEILRGGGNAIDAAVATQFALAVVYPRAGNIGGGGFSIIHLKSGKNVAINFRETAPGKAHKDMYLDKNGQALTHLAQDGHLSAGVPGSVAGMYKMLRYGRLPLKKLMTPAIELAEKGFAITARQAASLTEHQEKFKKFNTVIPDFVREGGWQAGDILIQPDLACTLKRIAEKGAAEFYTGETARLLVAEMERGGGIITFKDLHDYTAIECAPIEFQYHGYKILTMPLPSSGGIILEQMLKTSQLFGLDKLKFGTPEAVNMMTEIARRSYADRAIHLGDADFYNVPLKTLTNSDYLKKRMQDFRPGVAGNSKDIAEGIIAGKEETTHYNVVDNEGNAVAVTTTINGGYGSQVVVGHAGFLLNDEMDDFSIKPGVPNMFGAVGHKANEIQPHKRMLSSMTPTIVLKNDKPQLVLGTPGGTTITTSVYQTIVNIMDFGLSVHDAVNKPKFHHQWKPDLIYLEEKFDKGVKKELEKMGYQTKVREDIGRTEVIKINDDCSLTAVADHRGDDGAAGY